jgi:hypothetical protein
MKTMQQFDVKSNLDALLAIPKRLLRQACGMPGCPRTKALVVQAALAVEFLLIAPMRIGELAALRAPFKTSDTKLVGISTNMQGL